ncbi:hypothetical protein Tco_0932621 [Tanacetum coccineum]
MSYDVRELDGETRFTLYSLDSPFGCEVFKELKSYCSFSDNVVYEGLRLVAILQEEKLLVLGLKKESHDITLIMYDLRARTEHDLSNPLTFNSFGDIQAIQYKERVVGLADVPLCYIEETGKIVICGPLTCFVNYNIPRIIVSEQR